MATGLRPDLPMEAPKSLPLRTRVFLIVEAGASDSRLARAFDMGMICLIFVNVLAVTLETVESLHTRYALQFYWFEVLSVAVFSAEYVLRVWGCVDTPRGEYAQPVSGRLRYMMTPMALIDLFAILPFYLTVFFTVDLRFMRVFRLLRILKLTRYSNAMDTLLRVFVAERKPLFAGITIMLTLLVFLSGIVYFIEKDAQPVKFGSIPDAMWWGMATLTTVGYGDVVPVTPLGRVVGALVTLLGLGMFALPAAILGSGFTREASRHDFTISWNLVANVKTFENLRAVEIGEIANMLKPRVAVPGEYILREGEMGNTMYFIISGRVEVLLAHAPVILGAGDHVGEMAVVFHEKRVADVRALTSCQMMALDYTEFQEFLARHDEVREEIEHTARQRMAANEAALGTGGTPTGEDAG